MMIIAPLLVMIKMIMYLYLHIQPVISMKKNTNKKA